MKVFTFLFSFVVIFSAGVASAENGTKHDLRPPGEFCGRSTSGKCINDPDCVRGGCSRQVCQSAQEEPVITTCEWKECYNAAAFELECRCANERCQWEKPARK